MSSNTKIIIVEEDIRIANRIALSLLQFDYTTIAISHDSEESLDLVYNHQPDLVLLDVSIKGTKDGIEVAEIIGAKYDIPYIFITALSDPYTIERAKRLRPIGYIVKPLRENDLYATISIGMANYKALNQHTSKPKSSINTIAMSPLSGKEIAILLEISKGKTNVQIAKSQDVSHNTIKWHTQNIYSKLGVKNRIAAAQLMLSI